MINYCKTCKKEIPINKKFCNQSCYISFLQIPENNPMFNKNHSETSKLAISLNKTGIKLTEEHKRKIKDSASRGNNHWNYKHGETLIKHYCLVCNKEISYMTSLKGTGKCSSCIMKELYSIPEKCPNWQNGKSYEIYPLGWNKTFKEQIRRRDEYKCQICGIPEVENDRKLHVHHIDYNKKNISPNNLISLCTSCHVKTNTERNYWKELLSKKERIICQLGQ